MPPPVIVAPPHPAALSEEALLAQCQLTFGRGSGPGGQHRNKVETAVRILHRPTNLSAFAGERRRQHENRLTAVRRLRLRLALELRTEVDAETYRPSPRWRQRRQGRGIPVNPRHRDYPALLAEALDLIVARSYDVAGAAGALGVTMSQLVRLLRHERRALGRVNEHRRRYGLAALK